MLASTLGLLASLIAVGGTATGRGERLNVPYKEGLGFYGGLPPSAFHRSAAGGRLDAVSLDQTGSYPFYGGSAIALDTIRKLAFVGAGGGVLVVDVSDPAHPVELSDRIRGPMSARDLALHGDYLYVANFAYNDFHNSTQDVQVWNVADPANPVEAADLDLSFAVPGLDVQESLLAACTVGELALYNVKDGMPECLADLAGTYFIDVALRDTFMFLARFLNDIEVWSIADVAHPRFLSAWGHVEIEPHITVDGNRMYLTYVHMYDPGYTGGLWIYDITDPLNGRLVGAYDTMGRSIPWHTVLHDTFAVLASWMSLRVLSVADPTNVRALNTLSVGCYGFVWQDTLGYAALSDRFAIFNLANPGQPREVNSLPLDRTGRFVPGNGMIYSITDRLWVLDQVHYPEIRKVGTPDLGPELGGISLQDSIGVASAWDTTRLMVLGLSDPAHPAVLAVETLAGYPLATLSDSLCYVASGGELLVYNLARPGNPELIGNLSTPISGTPIKNADSLLLCCGDRLQVIGVADPRHPRLLLDTAIQCGSAAVQDTFLYGIARETVAISIYSTADPRHLRLLGEVGSNVGTYLTQFDTLLVTAYSDVYSGNLQVFSLSNPSQPRLIGSYQTDFCIDGLFLQHDTMYLSYRIGLYRYRLIVTPSGIDLEPIGGRQVEELHVWPSLTRGVLHLRGAQSATLLDVSGRTAAQLVAGENVIRGLAPGVYFVREQAANHGMPSKSGRVAKVVLTR